MPASVLRTCLENVNIRNSLDIRRRINFVCFLPIQGNQESTLLRFSNWLNGRISPSGCPIVAISNDSNSNVFRANPVHGFLRMFLNSDKTFYQLSHRASAAEYDTGMPLLPRLARHFCLDIELDSHQRRSNFQSSSSLYLANDEQKIGTYLREILTLLGHHRLKSIVYFSRIVYFSKFYENLSSDASFQGRLFYLPSLLPTDAEFRPSGSIRSANLDAPGQIE